MASKTGNCYHTPRSLSRFFCLFWPISARLGQLSLLDEEGLGLFALFCGAPFALHAEGAVEQNPFLDHQDRGFDVPLHLCRSPQLDLARRLDVPLEASAQDQGANRDLRLNVGCFADDQGVAGSSYNFV